MPSSCTNHTLPTQRHSTNTSPHAGTPCLSRKATSFRSTHAMKLRQAHIPPKRHPHHRLHPWTSTGTVKGIDYYCARSVNDQYISDESEERKSTRPPLNELDRPVTLPKPKNITPRRLPPARWQPNIPCHGLSIINLSKRIHRHHRRPRPPRT